MTETEARILAIEWAGATAMTARAAWDWYLRLIGQPPRRCATRGRITWSLVIDSVALVLPESPHLATQLRRAVARADAASVKGAVQGAAKGQARRRRAVA